jgi:hypothetical protein
MTTSQQKRKCLLACARQGLSLAAVNSRLKAECLSATGEAEWSLWTRYYVEIIRNDPYFEHELIANGRALPWFAQELKRRKTKSMLS